MLRIEKMHSSAPQNALALLKCKAKINLDINKIAILNCKRFNAHRAINAANLDREGVQVDLLEGLNLAVLDEAAEFRHRHPLLVAFFAAATAASTASASAASTTATTSAYKKLPTHQRQHLKKTHRVRLLRLRRRDRRGIRRGRRRDRRCRILRGIHLVQPWLAKLFNSMSLLRPPV